MGIVTNQDRYQLYTHIPTHRDVQVRDKEALPYMIERTFSDLYSLFQSAAAIRVKLNYVL